MFISAGKHYNVTSTFAHSHKCTPELPGPSWFMWLALVKWSRFGYYTVLVGLLELLHISLDGSPGREEWEALLIQPWWDFNGCAAWIKSFTGGTDLEDDSLLALITSTYLARWVCKESRSHWDGKPLFRCPLGDRSYEWRVRETGLMLGVAVFWEVLKWVMQSHCSSVSKSQCCDLSS